MNPAFTKPLWASDLLLNPALIPRAVAANLHAALREAFDEPFNARDIVCNLRGSTIVALYRRSDRNKVIVRVSVETEHMTRVEAVFRRYPIVEACSVSIAPPREGKVTTCDVMEQVRKILNFSVTNEGEICALTDSAYQHRIRHGGIYAACSILVKDYKASLAYWDEVNTYLEGAKDIEGAIADVFSGIGSQLQAACATKGGGFFLKRIREHLPDLTQYYAVDFGAIEIPVEFTKGLVDSLCAGLLSEVLEVLEHFGDPTLQARIILRCLADALRANQCLLLADFKIIAAQLFGGYSEPHEMPEAVRAVVCFECMGEYHQIFDSLFSTLPLSLLKSSGVAWFFGFRIGQELKTSENSVAPTCTEDYVTLIDRYLAGRLVGSELDRDEFAPKIAAGIIFGARGCRPSDTLTLLDALERHTTGDAESKRAFWSMRVLYSIEIQNRREEFRNAEKTFFGEEILRTAQAEAVGQRCDGEAYFHDLMSAVDSWLIVTNPTLSDHIKYATVEFLKSLVPSNGFPNARLDLAERFYRSGQIDSAFTVLPDFTLLPKDSSSTEIVAVWKLRKLAFDTQKNADELQETLDNQSFFGGWVHPVLSASLFQCDNQPFFSHVEEAAAHGLWKEVLRLIDGAELIVAELPAKTSNAIFKGLLRFQSSQGPRRQ